MKKISPEFKKYTLVSSASLQGEEFFRAYEVIVQKNKELEKKIVNQKYPERPVLLAHYSILAFSIELFLKAICLSLNKPSGRSHDIYKLFNNLPREIKEQIIILMKRNFYSEEVFKETLYKHSRSYALWRYFHENLEGRFDSKFCVAFARAIKKVLDNILKILHEDAFKAQTT